MSRFNWAIFLDGLCLILTGLFGSLLHVFGQPFERGIFCNDPTITYPLRGSLISSALIFSLSFLTPLIVIIIVEGIRARALPKFSKKCLSGSNDKEGEKTTRTTRKGSFLKTVIYTYCVYLFGAGVAWAIIGVSKVTIGRLRPHFLAVCNPREIGLCTSGTVQYIEHVTCQGDETAVREARLSFPSGHAALSVYYAIFICLYLEIRGVLKNLPYTRATLQLLIIISSLYIGLSRISDYWHHWTDVLAGMLLGMFSSFLVYFVYLRNLDSLNRIENTGKHLEATQLLTVKTSNDHTTSNGMSACHS